MPSPSFGSSATRPGSRALIGLAGQLRMWAGEAAAAIEDLERAAWHASVSGDRLQEIESLHYVLICAMHGPITVTSGLERAEQMRGQVEGDHRLKVTVMRARALFEAMRGNFDVARELIAAALALAEQLGLEVDASGAHSDAAEIELLAGRPGRSRARSPPLGRLASSAGATWATSPRWRRCSRMCSTGRAGPTKPCR